MELCTHINLLHRIIYKKSGDPLIFPQLPNQPNISHQPQLHFAFSKYLHANTLNLNGKHGKYYTC